MPTYLARFLLPVATPPIEDGAVTVEAGRITAVGKREELLGGEGGPDEVRDLGSVAVLPGLVNAHTHIELSWMGTRPPAGEGYTEWLRELLALRPAGEPGAMVAAAEDAARRMAARGTVAVGDVANDTWVVPVVARAGFHGVCFLELLGMKTENAEEILATSAGSLDALSADPDCIEAAERLRVALTPHAPHTTSVPLLRAMAGRSAATGEPLSVHVAESTDEVRLLNDGGGPLATLFHERDFVDHDWEPPRKTPVEHLDRHGVLSPRTIAVHCVHLEQHDHSKLQARGITVVTCPRSNERLGVGTAPIPKLLREGVPVAIGTDSLASSPDLDLFAEMQALCRAQPSLKPAAVLRMATLNGARALGVDTNLGSIEAGKLAELVVVPLDEGDRDPLAAVCSTPETVHRLAVAPWEPAP